MPHRIIHWFERIPARRFLLGLILLQFLLHLPVYNLPPMGQHTWRQAMGLATARNYWVEKNEFWRPRQDVRIAADDVGEAYFELPLIYWLIGQSYNVTGFSHANGRLIQFLMGAFLLVSAYYFARALGYHQGRAKWFTLALASSPYFFYYSVSISPNLPALAWFLGGVALILPELKAERFGFKYWLGGLFLVMATLSKATWLFFGLPLAWLFVSQLRRNKNLKVLINGGLLGALVLVPSLFIFKHARQIYDLAPQERQYYIELGPKPFPEDLIGILTPLWKGFFEWYPQIYINWALLPFFVYGIWVAFKHKAHKSERGLFFLIWLISYLAFVPLFLVQLTQHEYYLTPLLVIAAMASAYGIEAFLLSKGQRIKHVAILLLVFSQIIMVGRVSHRWQSARQVPDELLERLPEFEEVLPKEARLLIIGDPGPVVWLYYLNRKGLVQPIQVVDAETLDRYQSQGIDWLVTDDENVAHKEALKDRLELVKEIGHFRISRILPPQL